MKTFREFASFVKTAIMFMAILGGFVAALFAGIAIPIYAGYWFWAIPITVAVFVALPSYYKALKWVIYSK